MYKALVVNVFWQKVFAIGFFNIFNPTKLTTMNTKTPLVIATSIAMIAASCASEEPKQEAPKKEITPAFDISQIDSAFSPCEDFEQFAAGNWLKTIQFPNLKAAGAVSTCYMIKMNYN